MDLATVASPLAWGAFFTVVSIALALDLGVFHRTPHAVSTREALLFSAVWVALALAFGAGVWWAFGAERGVEFYTGYLIEKMLSIDNVFVFVLIFSALKIPAKLQHRVLFWGVFGAIVMRAVMIFAGAALLARFHWLLYVFGAFLVITGVKLYRDRNREADPNGGRGLALLRRWMPNASPFFLAIVLVELSDLVFAVDSIPAVFAVTLDPFVVLTSNVFAMLGLRSLYFLAAGLVERFRHLKTGLAAVLVFVGLKMLAADHLHLAPWVSLGVIGAIMSIAGLASWRAEAHSSSSARI